MAENTEELIERGRLLTLVGEEHDVIPLEVIAKHYGVSERTIADKQWRKKAGLKVTRLGGRVVGVQLGDLRRALASGF